MHKILSTILFIFSILSVNYGQKIRIGKGGNCEFGGQKLEEIYSSNHPAFKKIYILEKLDELADGGEYSNYYKIGRESGKKCMEKGTKLKELKTVKEKFSAYDSQTKGGICLVFYKLKIGGDKKPKAQHFLHTFFNKSGAIRQSEYFYLLHEGNETKMHILEDGESANKIAKWENCLGKSPGLNAVGFDDSAAGNHQGPQQEEAKKEKPKAGNNARGNRRHSNAKKEHSRKGERKGNKEDEEEEEMKKYYDALNLPTTATLGEVKKAWMGLAKAHHPDKGGGDGEKFKEVQEAYEKITNSEKEFVPED